MIGTGANSEFGEIFKMMQSEEVCTKADNSFLITELQNSTSYKNIFKVVWGFGLGVVSKLISTNNYFCMQYFYFIDYGRHAFMIFFSIFTCKLITINIFNIPVMEKKLVWNNKITKQDPEYLFLGPEDSHAEEYGHTRQAAVLLFLLYHWRHYVSGLVPGQKYPRYVQHWGQVCKWLNARVFFHISSKRSGYFKRFSCVSHPRKPTLKIECPPIEVF